MKKLISTLVLAIFTSFCAMAQSKTIDITAEGLTSLQTYGRVLLEATNADETAFQTLPGFPCEEQMTAALSAYMQALADACCCPRYTCVQSSDCAWVAYMFLPNPACGDGPTEGPAPAY